MADVSVSSAPASSTQGAPLGDDVKPVDGARQCGACGNPVKGHLGPCGKGKCFFGTFEKLLKRIESLEAEREDARKIHDEHVRLSEERQTSLLKTIVVLQEEVDVLRSEMKKVRVDDRSTGSPPRPSSPIEWTPSSADVHGTTDSQCTLSPTHNHDNSPSSPDTLGAASQAKTAEKPETALDNANADRNAVPENSGKPQTEENQAEVENGSVWVTQQRRRRQVQDRSRPALSGASRGDDQRPRSKGLHGARSVQCCALHLSHISLESKVEDVLTHCRQRRVNVAGCFFIRSRNWGTQSAKIFVADSFVDDVLKEGFWPEMIECRRWESTPPRRSRARLSDNQ